VFQVSGSKFQETVIASRCIEAKADEAICWHTNNLINKTQLCW